MSLLKSLSKRGAKEAIGSTLHILCHHKYKLRNDACHKPMPPMHKQDVCYEQASVGDSNFTLDLDKSGHEYKGQLYMQSHAICVK